MRYLCTQKTHEKGVRKKGGGQSTSPQNEKRGQPMNIRKRVDLFVIRWQSPFHGKSVTS